MGDKFTEEGKSWIDFHYSWIHELKESGLYVEALAATDESLKIWPDQPLLLLYKSLILLDLHRPTDAMRNLRKVQKTAPFDLTAYDSLGKNLMFQGYYHTALKVLSHFDLMTIFYAGETSFILNVCRFFTGDILRVLKFCDSILDSYENDEELEKTLATFRALKSMCLVRSGEEEKARELVDLIVSSHIDRPFVAYAAGMAARATGDLNQAVIYLNRALEYYPLDMRARSDLAEVLEQLGRSDEANEVKDSITGFFGPEESDPWPGIRGEELLLSGRFDEAFVTLQKCYEENPDDQEILTMLIKSLHFCGEYDKAVMYADKAKDNAKAWKIIYYKAASLYQQGKTVESFRCICCAGARDRGFIFYTLLTMLQDGWFKPDGDLAGDALGFQVFLNDGLDAGIPPFEMMCDMHPDVPEYRAFLVLLYIFTNRFADSVIVSGDLKGNEDPDFSVIRVLALRAAGCMNDAEREAEEVLSRYPDYLPAINMYLYILLEQERYREAFSYILSHNLPVNTDPFLEFIRLRCLIRAGFYEGASTVAENIIVVNPGRPYLFPVLVQAFFLTGNYPACLYTIREWILQTGISSEAALSYVKALLQSGVFEEADRVLKDTYIDLPDSSEARYLKSVAAIFSENSGQNLSESEALSHVFNAEKGVLRAYIGDYLAAARLLEIEIMKDPLDYSLREDYAELLFKMERNSEGLQQLSLIPEKQSRDPRVQMLIKKGLENLSIDSGVEDLVRIGGDSLTRQVELVHERAARLKDFGVKQRAIDACSWITSQKSEDPAILRYIADAFHMLGDLEDNPSRYDEALDVYNKLISKCPDDVVFLTEKGLILNNLDRYAEAEIVLRKAAGLDPEYGKACSALCWALNGLEKEEEALEFGNRAVLLIPDEWSSWNNRGLVKHHIRNFKGAVSDFRQAVRCLPSEKIARLNLLNALVMLENDDAPDVYYDIIVRFGDLRLSGEGSDDPFVEDRKSLTGRGKLFKTVAGYMDGYL